LPGATKFQDRHGKWRWRARAKGKKAAMLPGAYRSPEFVAAWNAWANGRLEIGAERTVPGTISALLVEYYASDPFNGLSANTQKAYRAMLERFRAKSGGRVIHMLTHEEIRLVRNKLKPEPSNMFLRCIRHLCRWAVDADKLKRDPTAGMKKRKNLHARKGGIHTWTIEEVAQFEERHAFGTKARLALDLLLYTSQRKSDVVTLGRQHEAAGGLKFRQKKTGEWMELPLVAPLRASIAAAGGAMTYIETMRGRPFTAAGFGNWFRDRCDEAGLPQCSSHGLRKATATRLADAGATPHQIMAITGHRSLSEVENYTREANKKRMARQMAGVLAGSKDALDDGKPDLGFANSELKAKSE
jgi:integrase